MATNKKTLSQGNLVDMLAAFGRGALGTLTDRFNQYDAAVESVARHEQTLDKHLQVLNSISEAKVEWFVIPITAAVYEDILSGVKDYITIPYDISTLIDGDSQLKSGQAGIKLEVADEASVNAVYLPFTLVSQAYILPSFDDLVIRGTSLSSGKAYDTRYHVNVDAETNYIKLEKVKESAGAALQEWIIPTLDAQDINDEIYEGDYAQPNYFNFDASKAKIGDIVKVADNANVTLTIIGINQVESGYPVTLRPEFVLFKPGKSGEGMEISGLILDRTYGGLNTLLITSDYVRKINLNSYAKKTDIPQQPFTFVVNGDNLKIGSRKLDIFVLNDCYPGTEFSIVLSTDIQSKLNGIIGELNAVLSETASSDFSVRTSDITSRMPKFFLRISSNMAMICFQSAQSHNVVNNLYRLSFYAAICNTDAYYSTRWLADYTSGDGRLTFKCIKQELVQDLS